MVKLKRPLFAAVTVVPVMISDDADARSENVMVVEAGMFELVQVMEREEPATQVDPPTLTVIEYVPPPGPPGSVGPPPPPPAFRKHPPCMLSPLNEHPYNIRYIPFGYWLIKCFSI